MPEKRRLRYGGFEILCGAVFGGMVGFVFGKMVGYVVGLVVGMVVVAVLATRMLENRG